MDKPEQFRQDNPQDQLTAILQSIEGSTDNLVNGIKPDDSYCLIMLHIKQIRTLGKWLSPNW